MSQLVGLLPAEDQGLMRVMNMLMEIYGVLLDKSLLLTDSECSQIMIQ